MNTVDHLRGFKVSVIIPCWRDGAALVELIRRMEPTSGLQWIVVLADPDAGVLRALARLPVDVIRSDCPNRGSQMNRGAELAKGDILLFHHVDSLLTYEHLHSLRSLNSSEPIAGAFYRKFDQRHPLLCWAEPIERWHCRAWGTLYGDQSIFVSTEFFRRSGGFANIPLMEDVEFSRRLRRRVPIIMLDPPMQSSPRKHLEEGSWRTTLRNLTMLILFQLGISPHSLHRWYYRSRRKKKTKSLIDLSRSATPL
jgi:glycosyltransferase involved in cell wall biosynthesis